jgi:hypothetical protein
LLVIVDAHDRLRESGVASHIGQLKGDANAYLTDPTYDGLKLRLENALSAVEATTIQARRRVRMNEGRSP